MHRHMAQRYFDKCLAQQTKDDLMSSSLRIAVTARGLGRRTGLSSAMGPTFNRAARLGRSLTIGLTSQRSLRVRRPRASCSQRLKADDPGARIRLGTIR